MPATLQRPRIDSGTKSQRVTPSILDPKLARPFTLDQELDLFGNWTGSPIWVPPKDSSTALAETMVRKAGLLTSAKSSWQSVVEEHREQFTQVRELNLHQASIRLPKGKFFVKVTEQERFDEITDPIPACVQTRLQEFMDGPGKRKNVKLYYLKPLCVEVDDQLIMTTREDLNKAIKKIQDEVFQEYRLLYLGSRPKYLMAEAVNAALTLPRQLVNYCVQRRQKAIDSYQAQLEFKRRKTALRAARVHGRFRTDGCSFDEMLDLTNPLERADVIEQYGAEQELSRAKRDQLIKLAAGSVPWFVSLAVTASWLSSLSVILAPPVLVCDPAFVAEMPGSNGKLLKIGHFDEVAGVTHVEI